MTFPVVATRATGRTTTTNTTSHAITLPASIAAGDLLIVSFATDGNPTVSVNTGVSGNNWQAIGQASNSTIVTGAVFWKIAEGSDALTLTTSASEQSSHVSLRITGGTNVTGTSANGSSTNSDPPNHTAQHGTQDYLWIATRAGDSTVVATAAPGSYANLQTLAAAGTGGASSNTAERSVNGASENPGTFTSASEQWVCWTLSVSPIGRMSGVSDGASTVTGALSGRGALAGAVAGESAVTATLTGRAGLSGAVAGASSVTGTLTAASGTTGPLSGTVAGASTVSGVLRGLGRMSGAVAGASTATGVLRGRGALAGAVAGASGVTGAIRGRGALSGASAGASAVSGVLRGNGALSGAVAGASSVAGVLTEASGSIGPLSGTVAAVSSVTGVLTGYALPLFVGGGSGDNVPRRKKKRRVEAPLPVVPPPDVRKWLPPLDVRLALPALVPPLEPVPDAVARMERALDAEYRAAEAARRQAEEDDEEMLLLAL